MDRPDALPPVRTVRHLDRTARYQINGPIAIDDREVGELYREAGAAPGSTTYTVRTDDGELIARANSASTAAMAAIEREA